MPYDIVVAVLQGIPESIVLVFFVYAVLKLRAVPVRILALGLLNVSIVYAVRTMNLPFPAHTLFGLAVMPVAVSTWERISLKAAVLGWAFALGVLLFLESAMFGCIVWSGIPVQVLLADRLWFALSGLPQVLLMAILALWIHRHAGVKFLRRYIADDPKQ